MKSIVGEPFDDFVSKQIVDRQNIHGQGFATYRDNNTIAYLNSRTSWIKLSSGVSIQSKERLDRIGLQEHPSFIGPDGTNTGLSNFFVLFNGTSDNAGTPYGGIDIINGQPNQDMGQSILNKVAYGIGGTEFGLRPMPGITSCDTKFRNRGSIREGTITIKAYNRSQLEIISLLYLRLGFPMLLEWGHSVIIDKEGKVDTKPDFSISKNFLGLEYKTDNDVLKALETQREASAGNYDGMYGRVVNFDWTFNKDGSYDITLKLISIGAIIESLKVNTYIKDFKSSTSKPSDSAPETDKDWITTYKYSHTIGIIFFKAYTKLEVANASLTSINSQDIQGELSTFDKIIDYIPFVRLFFQPEVPPGKSKDYIRLTGSSGLYYVRFGEFLRILQLLVPNDVTNLSKPTSLINIISKNNKGEPLPITMYTENYQISGDPKICIVGGFKMNDLRGKDVEILPELNSNSFKTSANGIMVGDLNNVYVDMAFILQKLNDLQDGNNKVVLIDLLKSVLEGINKALGGINQLEASIDETTNTVKIIDQTPIPGFDQAFPEIANKLKESATFNLYGYYNNNTTAGFIRDFSLKTEITNELVSMLTIGATANGQVVGEDATAFSKWNKGLKPIVASNIDYTSSELTKKSYKQQYSEIAKANSELKTKFINYVLNIYNKFKFTQSEDNLQIVVNYLAFENQYNIIRKKYIEEIRDSKNKAPTFVSATSSRGFLPINLSLTMDGLSGIKIYQQIKVDTAYLPTEYPTALKFIIKGVSNKIDASGWTTSIETVSIPVIDFVNGGENSSSTSGASSSTNATTAPTAIAAPAATASPTTSSPLSTTPSTPGKTGCPSDGEVYVKAINAPEICVNKYMLAGRNSKGGFEKVQNTTALADATIKTYTKTQIYIHHTAGWAYPDKGKQTVDWWNKSAATTRQGQIAGRSWCASSPYVLDRDGFALQLADDKYFYVTQGCDVKGAKAETNTCGIGIEVCNPGQAKQDNNGNWIALGTNITERWGKLGFSSQPTLGNGISELVDWNGKAITFRTFKYAVSYPPAQIAGLEKLIKKLMSTHNIPFKWEGEKTYKEIFPDIANIKLNAPNGVPGIYTHGSVFTGKSDSLPTRELVEMLKRLGK